MKILPALLIVVFFQLLAGCATTPRFDTKDVTINLTPLQVSDSPQQSIGKNIIWGGKILSVKNLANATQLEILALPLSSKFRPDNNATSLGRFLLLKDGYLEVAEYSEGRYTSVHGTLTGFQRNRIGDTDYNYPVVKVNELFLWPSDFDTGESSVHFGIGISISR